MAANVLNSDRAVEASVQVVRAFVHLRNLVSSHKEIAAELAKLEARVAKHDKEIKVIFDAIRRLMMPSPKTPPRIGFRPKSMEK